MKFKVKDLKQLTMIVLFSGTKFDDSIRDFIAKKQPFFLKIVEEVDRDQRCFDAYKFCTLFSVAALIYTRKFMAEPIPPFTYSQVHDLAESITKKDELTIGRRATTYPDRIKRHVLFRLNFDENDSKWLCTIISTFLILIEKCSP